MSGVTIRLDTTPVQHLLGQLVDKLEDMTPVMGAIGEILVTQTTVAFETESSPGGAPWKPSERALKTGDLTLQLSGALKQDIFRVPSAHSVMVGSPWEYAAIHQFGGATGRNHATLMPSRPFLPDDQTADWEEITATLLEYLE